MFTIISQIGLFKEKFKIHTKDPQDEKHLKHFFMFFIIPNF